MVQVQIRLSIEGNKVNYVVEGLTAFGANEKEKVVGEILLRENVTMLSNIMKATGHEPNVHEIPAQPLTPGTDNG
jgi:hypothetical protein